MASSTTVSFLHQRQPRVDVPDKDVPTGWTTEYARDMYLIKLEVKNPTSGPITIQAQSVSDSRPCFPPQIIRASSVFEFSRPEGKLLLGGIQWMASATGLTGDIVGVERIQ